ncbi:hypothetical protein VNO77_04926 [Canavalia gladiata]|uniref:Uncharacterized protein n=1 Tax=Canavalia gladiata TaxID=3824 RepID=A0AAN9N2H0_CANGL
MHATFYVETGFQINVAFSFAMYHYQAAVYHHTYHNDAKGIGIHDWIATRAMRMILHPGRGFLMHFPYSVPPLWLTLYLAKVQPRAWPLTKPIVMADLRV